MSSEGESLETRLADRLPVGCTFKYYHISTPPTKTAALFSAPPGSKPETTYCQSHFLLVSTLPDEHDSHEIAVYAIEVLVYTTTKLTTLFVSKVDSTGWLSLLNLPRTSESPIRSITSIFISFLARQHHRPGRKLVVALFARSQKTYLFPGSPENVEKHTLDDSQLIKWWCRSLDPVLREYPSDEKASLASKVAGISTKAYLIIPGLEERDTSAFFPTSSRNDPPGYKRWINGHPLYTISSFPNAPPRCIIPHFPDDPKTRYLLRLDEGIRDTSSGQAYNTISPSKRGGGHWKGVKTVDQFWTTLAIQAECNSGRRVGFIWITFTAPVYGSGRDVSEERPLSSSPTPKPRKAQLPKQRPKLARKRALAKGLKGPIIPRAPRVKSVSTQSDSARSYPEKTPYYFSPKSARGRLILTEKGYTRLHELLLRLDFANLDVARGGTAKWAREAAVIGGSADQDWGVRIAGRRTTSNTVAAGLDKSGTANISPPVNVLTVKKKRKAQDSETTTTEVHNCSNADSAFGHNVPEGNHPSKSHKVDAESISSTVNGAADSGVNMLGSSLVRKKPKIS